MKSHGLLLWSVTAAALLLLPLQAKAEHPLLEVVPDEVKLDPDVHDRYCTEADRIVIAKVQSAQYAQSTASQIASNWPTYYTTATMNVERSATQVAAPQVSSFDIRLPGGIAGGTIASVSHYPLMEVGQRYLLVLTYPGGAPYTTMTPIIQRWLRLPPNANLPSNTSLNDALQEYCSAY